MPLHRCAFDPQGSYTHTEAMSVMAAVSSWGLYGDFYWVECLELTEQLRVLLESCVRKASHCNGGRRRSQPRSWEGGAHPFDAALGLPQQLWEPSLPQAVSVPASAWARRGWRNRLWAGLHSLAKGKKINKHFLTQGREAFRSSKDSCGIIFLVGLECFGLHGGVGLPSLLCFMYMLSIYFWEVSRIKDYHPFSGIEQVCVFPPSPCREFLIPQNSANW